MPNMLEVLSSGVWEDLGNPIFPSVTSISGRLLTSGMLGSLDSIDQTCHFIDYNSGIINPELVSEEQAIYAEIYKSQYYRKLATQVINNIGNPTSLVYRLREGDSDILMSDSVNLSRLARDLEKQSLDRIKTLSTEFKKGLAGPKSVDYPTIVQSPTYGPYIQGDGPYVMRGNGY